ncbi:MAG: aminotransferase class I/II-fold pyridoxal phosphate-dependent enzyme [Tissierellales bacterium]|nr:aminotransferase class I/II-fold pyridoxal phosphate-dependent enzyme [Tissierellales bacterium]MBN2827101.1 aminotransferase class I/II-fold pyridoxal phosphate-dependent enzyme [Tissierellales bacterium]
MKINDFRLEVYFGEHEFSAPYLLGQSDCEAMTVRELLSYESDSEKAFMDSWLGYTEVAGSDELRTQIAQLYSQMNSDEIIVHSGAQEAIFNFMNVLLNKGDHVITMFPTYQSLFEVANAIGCQVSQWNLRQGNKGWVLDLEELEALVTPQTKLICINTPNNPTGYTLTDEESARIIEIARAHNIYIFSDEVYKGLELDGIKRSWIADQYEKAVTLGVMSKAYGLPGLRIGWIATKDQEMIESMMKYKHYTTICNSATSEYLATVALKNGQRILNRNLEIIKHNLEASDEFFEKYSNLFTYNKPMCGPIAFHKLNLEIPIRQFCDTMVKEQGVLLLPADMYFFEGNYFRMGYGRKNFKENLKHFENYLIKKEMTDKVIKD